MPVARSHRLPPSSRFAIVRVPVGLSPTYISSPTLMFCNILVSGPSATFILKNSIKSSYGPLVML